MNQCNPRDVGPTPEPLAAELAARTRHELRRMYHQYQAEGALRWWLKEAWMSQYVVHAPCLSHYSDDVGVFPPVAGIKNGYILPARIRAYILGLGEEVPPNKDPFLASVLKSRAVSLRIAQPSQVPYEDNFLSTQPWLNQTTAVYFEPEFEQLWLEYMARGFSAAWRKVDDA